MSGFQKYDPPILLCQSELFWARLQPFLLSRGYQLRRRYQPNWKPSRTPSHPIQEPHEDELLPIWPSVLDGVSIRDGKKVVLKRVRTNTNEITLGLFFSTETIRRDPRNCICPILDVIPVPADDDWALLVMPCLYPFDALPFRRVGEFAEAILQFLQGMELMHENIVAHRDMCYFNFMMDASRVIPKGFHFGELYSHDGLYGKKFRWCQRWKVRPVKYYIIDFDISERFTTSPALMLGRCGQDKTAPEFSKRVPFDAFKLDIYQLGNVILRMVNKYQGLEVFQNLGKQMTRPIPQERPTASEALRVCQDLVASLGWWDKRRRVWGTGDFQLYSFEKFLVRFCGWNAVM